jgi:transposase InsO family protein
MNIHKNARLTLARRLELVRDIVDKGFTPCTASAVHGVTEPTARKWLGRYLSEGKTGLHDRSSRPKRSPRTIEPGKAVAIVELRRRRLTQARIAATVGVSKTTVSRVLKRAGLSRLSALEPSEPVVRYEHERPGDLVHIDIKRLGRIERLGHRVPGGARGSVRAGYEALFVAVDDHSRIGFTDVYPDQGELSAVQFLQNLIRYYHSLGVRVRRILTDNGSAFNAKSFARICEQAGVKHSFTRPFRPQTNGKAERFIQSALREWAYGIPYTHSRERTAMLERWMHHYNWHRPHQGINGAAPISRLPRSRNNLLLLHI